MNYRLNKPRTLYALIAACAALLVAAAYAPVANAQYSTQAPSCVISLSDYRVNSVYPYESATLTWSSWNTTSASISPTIGSVGLNGSQAIYPIGYQVYTMTVNGPGGTATCQTNAYGYVPAQSQYTGNLYCTISASPSSMQNGSSSYLTWTSYGATRAWLSDGIGTVAINGTLSVRPESSRTYTLTISDAPGRTNTCQTAVSVSGSHVPLTQIPYTGDFGPFGTSLAWLAVTLTAAAGAALIAARSSILRK